MTALSIQDWTSLDEAQRAAVLRRPAQREAASLLERTGRIVRDVRKRGDEPQYLTFQSYSFIPST